MSEIYVSGGANGGDAPKGVARKSARRRRSAVPVPERYRNRPLAIRTGIFRIWESSMERGFTRSTTAVLQAILALGVSAINPFAGVFAKKKTLAKAAVVSNTTLYRVLRFLEGEGWIVRSEQPRLEDGSLDLGVIFITNKLALLAGLTFNDGLVADISAKQINGSIQHCSTAELETQSAKGLQGDDPCSSGFQQNLKAASIETVDGLVDGSIYKEQCSYPKASVKNQSAAQPFVRIEGRSVPAELLWLITENRLTFGGLFDLMKKARSVAGQQLSNYVAYRSERIKHLKTPNDCYRYLLNLIQQGIDAKHLCAQRSKRSHQDTQKAQRMRAAEARAAWSRTHDGQTFIKPGSSATYRVNGTYSLIEIGDFGNPTSKPSLKLSSRFISAVEEGRLQPFVKTVVPSAEVGSRVSALLLQIKGYTFPSNSTCHAV